MDASNAVLDLTGDDADEMRRSKTRTVWDRKRKRFVNESGLDRGKRNVKTESGKKISSTYKTNIYQEWLQKNRVQDAESDNDDGNEQSIHERFGGRRRRSGQMGTSDKMHHGKRGPRSELREKSQIVKERTKRAAKKAYQLHRTEQRRRRKGMTSRAKRRQ